MKTSPQETDASNATSSNRKTQFRGRCPAELRFGTSGLRGLVAEITDLEAYVNTLGFVEYVRRIGDPGGQLPVSVAADLRPSSDGPDRSIVRAVLAALRDAGLETEYLGRIPTPALTHHGLCRGHLSIMVTGSHIPFDRNGIKFNKSTGEVLKSDEAGILEAVREVRHRLYAQSPAESAFADDGMFRVPAPPARADGAAAAAWEYQRRYLDFFGPEALGGLRVAFYQHSAVGRDLLVDLLRRLGAEVIPVGRSERFVAIDTEAISDATLADLQRMADPLVAQPGGLEAIVSTDGDSDRPLVAGLTPEGRVRFIPGDMLGALVAQQLGAVAAATPINANDALDQWAAERGVILRKTPIGSPHVINGMQQLVAEGRTPVVGWEANGGFLTGSALEHQGRRLESLPTRDAALPIVTALAAVRASGRSLSALQEDLPRRYGRAGLLDAFPIEASRRLVERLSPEDPDVREVDLATPNLLVQGAHGDWRPAEPALAAQLGDIRRHLARFFAAVDRLGDATRLNYLDGVRVTFATGEVIHVRPSGNAPQLRCYTVADTAERADHLLELALREPDGILRRMESFGK